MQPVPLLGYQHPIPYKWYQSWDSLPSQGNTNSIGNCENHPIGTVRLHRIVSCYIKV
jgi:hypothetical protein